MLQLAQRLIAPVLAVCPLLGLVFGWSDGLRSQGAPTASSWTGHTALARPVAPTPVGGRGPSRWGCHAGSVLSAGERDSQSSVRREGPSATKASAVD